ncbi:MAG: T9SS type A sorting domain-containing protein [Candidatus Kapabacteria bacterium]|nr:T9SS type A sorting domain-containing protein [Candidatus Kapabacteria bacterium]
MRSLCTLALLVVSSVAMLGQYWTETTGPAAPTVALASNSKGWVYAGTEYSKIYRSTDKGQTWEPFDQGIDDGIHFFTVSQIRVADNDVLYAAINGLGLLRSDDDGVTWRKLDINIPDIVTNARVFFDLKKLPDGKLRILLGYDGGTKALLLRRSDDGGETFTEVPKSNLPTSISSIFGAYMSPNSDKFFVLVSYNKGLYRSSNFGTTWTRIDSDPTSGESDDAFKTMAYDGKGHLYVGRNALAASTKTQNAVIMKSTNDGESWTYLTEGWDNRDITNNRVSSIAVGKNGLMLATLEKVSGPFRSTDYGATWTVVRDGFRNADGASKAVIITKDGEEYIAPYGEFVMRHGSSTGVDETSVSVRTDVFPNPANDRVRIDVAPFHAGAVEVNLFDAAGRQVVPHHRTTASKDAEMTIWLSTGDLPVGMYVATVRSASGVTTVPVAVAR